MKKFNLLGAILGVFCLLLVFSATQAYADTAKLTFHSNPNGEEYPYLFTVDNSSQMLMCFNNHTYIQSGESWFASVYTLANVANLTADTTPPSFPVVLPLLSSEWHGLAELYKAAKVSWEKGDKGLAAHYNDLAWALMDGSIDAGGVTEVSQLTYDVDNVLFYIWDGSPISNQYGGYAPQPMIGETPEPNSLLLLGTGLLGFATFLYYKKHNAVGSF